LQLELKYETQNLIIKKNKTINFKQSNRGNYMNDQTEIQIKVPLNVAQFYWNTTEEERQKIAIKIAFYLQSATSSSTRQQSLDRLYQTMDTIGQNAVERGLTPQVLESLLAEDE